MQHLQITIIAIVDSTGAREALEILDRLKTKFQKKCNGFGLQWGHRFEGSSNKKRALQLFC